MAESGAQPLQLDRALQHAVEIVQLSEQRKNQIRQRHAVQIVERCESVGEGWCCEEKPNFDSCAVSGSLKTRQLQGTSVPSRNALRHIKRPYHSMS